MFLFASIQRKDFAYEGKIEGVSRVGRDVDTIWSMAVESVGGDRCCVVNAYSVHDDCPACIQKTKRDIIRRPDKQDTRWSVNGPVKVKDTVAPAARVPMELPFITTLTCGAWTCGVVFVQSSCEL